MSLAPCRFPRGRVQSQAFTRSSSQRGNLHCAEDSHLRHAVDQLLSAVAPPPLRRLDKTGHHLSPAGDADRPCQKQVRTHGSKRTPASATYHPPSTVKRPACTKTDRMLLVLLARAVQTWKQALFIVQPETLLRWHRQGFRLFWKYTSRAAAPKPKRAAETVALIKAMAEQNRRLRCGADPWRIAQAGHSRVQADHSEVHEAHSHTATGRTELDHLLAQSCQRDLGLRLSPSH